MANLEEAIGIRGQRTPAGPAVKVAGLEDDLDVRRTATVSEDDVERLTKYHRAWRLLTGGVPE